MVQSRFAPRSGLDANRVRQGRLGRDVFWVLLISTLLALVALMASWAWNAQRFAATEPGHDVRAAAADRFNAPAPDSATEVGG